MERLISQRDRRILRELAKKQIELSQSPRMKSLEREWIWHNDCKSSHVMVVIEWLTFQQELIPPLLQCEGELARQMEAELYGNFVGHQLFGDDSVVKDHFAIKQESYFKPFNIDFGVVYAEDGNGVGHHFQEVIHDLEEDFSLLSPSSFGSNRHKTQEKKELAENLFGDILPVKITGYSLDVGLTRDLVHIMGMETMLFSMYDYPGLFHSMMQKLTNDYLEYFHYLEKNDLLLPTAGSEPVWQGSYAYTQDLPSEKDGKISLGEVWGYMDSQESSGISPQMYEEFMFPYYEQIGREFGLLSYGCCEPVDPIWERDISTFRNLRRVSISPWCNEEYMGEQLRGKRIVYHRKPSPNYLGVDKNLDEESFRKHIQKTMAAARGCTLEITQRDVYTVHHNLEKVRRYVEIIRQCAEER